MKLTAFISGALSFALIPIGVLFKIMHWPGAGIIITVGIGIFSLIFIPLISKFIYDRIK
jgi:hypothetical protein